MGGARPRRGKACTARRDRLDGETRVTKAAGGAETTDARGVRGRGAETTDAPADCLRPSPLDSLILLLLLLLLISSSSSSS
jgi:hypothetical protein